MVRRAGSVFMLDFLVEHDGGACRGTSRLEGEVAGCVPAGVGGQAFPAVDAFHVAALAPGLDVLLSSVGGAGPDLYPLHIKVPTEESMGSF